MGSHLRACAWLLGLTIVLCAVLYPLTLLGIGQTALRDQADGSLLTDEDGKVIGSRLIAQSFSGDEYFQPRPSAASYNGAASGASNWGASNPLLRARVAQQLGPIVRYGQGAEKFGKKPGELVGPDIETWSRANQYKDANRATSFEKWRQANPDVPLEEVPADMVMASASGLDPHITLDNALTQARYHVADAWATKLQPDEARRKQVRDRIHEEIVRLLNDRASAPLGGLAGVPLVNVLEVNLALRDRMRELSEQVR